MNASNETLPILMCQLIDVPVNGTDCSTKSSEICIHCPVQGGFIFGGGSIDDFGSPGHIVCLISWALTLIIGTVGTIMNFLIVSVIQKRNNKSSYTNPSFDFLLMMLAYFDMFSCIISTLSSTGSVVYFENWSGRGKYALYFYYIPLLMMLFGRSLSTYVTLLIAIERCLVVTFPIRSSTWFTLTKIKLLTLLAVVLAVLVSIPRFSSVIVGPKQERADIPSLQKLDYIIHSTSLNQFWYQTLGSVHYQIDFWLPLPIILLLNLLTFRKLLMWTDKRKELNKKQKKDLQGVRMFLPVVIVLLCCNVGPIVNYAMMHFKKRLFRELSMITILSIAVNSSVNFLIYYFRGISIRKESNAMVSKWTSYVSRKKRANPETATSATEDATSGTDDKYI